MASMRHEILVELFNNRPSLAAELLAESLHVPMPAYTEARIASIELTETQPAEYRADVVVVLYRDGKPVRVNIVEVQLRPDPDKPYVWPAYLAVSRERHRCHADLLVVAPDPAVATWCAQRIEIGTPGFVLEPPVLRRELIPQITDPSEAARRPELALLSAMAYGDSEQATEIAQAACSAFVELDDKRGGFYYDILYNSINEAARRALEVKMKGYEYTSPFMKKHIEMGRDEGLKLGRDEGLKLGRDEGFTQAVLTLLRLHGIDVPEATRQRMLAEKDQARLERWLERAAVAQTLAEVLDEPS
ncbi:MAG: hypothetical protein IPM54_15665 [Polyangiaceae bacterium]|nr:hypothetical protein [Polyangiaceae bacterium]